MDSTQEQRDALIESLNADQPAAPIADPVQMKAEIKALFREIRAEQDPVRKQAMEKEVLLKLEALLKVIEPPGTKRPKSNRPKSHCKGILKCQN